MLGIVLGIFQQAIPQEMQSEVIRRNNWQELEIAKGESNLDCHSVLNLSTLRFKKF